jgi:predicted GNAT superfamily acetyltransferase
MQIRDIVARDIEKVIRLNESSVKYLSPLSSPQLATLLTQSVYHKIIEINGNIVSFILAFDQNSDYKSPNYLWFKERYDNFIYIDRVVVQNEYRLQGIANYLYQQIFTYAEKNKYEIIACEIDIDPPNMGSLKFHEKYKFREVGKQRPYSGEKEVSLRISRILP